MDYALYASSYLKELNTEDKYFQYLSQNYAEDPNYVSKLRKIIQDKNLKQKFQ
jgi:flagellum-specific peptidoglycan hydrolase FlgJ